MKTFGPMVFAALASLIATAPARAQHAGDMLIASTAGGGGALTLVYDFANRVAVSESASGGGNTLYTGTDPGWDLLVAAGGGFFPITSGTPISVELTAIDPGVSLKIGATTLDAAGESRLLGTAPSAHVHPVWQLLLPTGLVAERTVSFRMTTTSASYAASVAYTAILTNAPATTTTSSSIAGTSSTTTTTLPAAGQELRVGTKLVLKDDPGNPAARRLLVLSRDLALTLGGGSGSGDDPTIAGGSLRIVSTASGFDATYPLPAAGWKTIGTPQSVKGYRYLDRGRENGPVVVAFVKAGKLAKAVGKGEGLAHTLAANPAPVDVVLALGAQRYCFRFGGVQKLDLGRQFKAVFAAPPAACAP
jgi:hypothetical protein